MEPRFARPQSVDLPDGLFCELPVQPSGEKYFASRFGRNSFIDSHIPLRSEGRIAIVTGVGAGCGGRFGDTRRAPHEADGEAVWSWRPDAGVKLATMPRIKPATVARKPGHRGEREISR
jgi:hypothetical protein